MAPVERFVETVRLALTVRLAATVRFDVVRLRDVGPPLAARRLAGAVARFLVALPFADFLDRWALTNARTNWSLRIEL